MKFPSPVLLAAGAVLLASGTANAQTGPASAPARAAAPAGDCMSPSADLDGTVARTTYRSRGREIQGLLFSPNHPNGAGVVMLHDREGLPRDLERYQQQLGRLASCGYTVIVPSYYDAGAARSVNDPMLGDKWKQAVDEAIVALTQAPGVQADRIAVMGYGRGGGIALDDAMNGIAARTVVAISSGARLENIHNTPPILLIVGDHDPDSPLYRAEDLAREMRKRDIDVTVQSAPANLHEFEPATWDAVFALAKAWFDQKLAPAS